MTDPGRTKRSPRDERRQQLLLAARQVFGSKGYHDATVDDITRAAGVAKGTFYLYFTEKRAILHELVQHFFGLVTELGLSVARDVASPAEFFQRLEEAARRLALIFRENRDLVRLTYRESMSADPELEVTVRDFYRRFAQVEAENVRRGIELGLFRDDLNPLIAAYAHIGMVERVLLQSLFDRAFPSDANLVAQLVQLAYRGLAREETGAANRSAG
jgi:AcrR family transcriptional regulator